LKSIRKFLTGAVTWSVLWVSALHAASPAESAAAAGRKALDLLLAGRYTELTQLLTPEARNLLTPEFLENRVAGELKSFGKVEEIGKPLIGESGGAEIVSFPLRCSNKSVSLQFTLTGSGLIAGLHFRSPEQPLPATWNRPSYSKPESFHDRAVTVGADQWKLGGTFTYPLGKGPFPAVVLVHGPGPNDRDESFFGTRIFADIAEGLASRGIAVLRYDKRTKVYGTQMSETAFTLQQETIEDAVRALAVVRHQPEVDPTKIFVLGHSLGGYAVPRIARQDGKLAGAIVLAGNARHIEDVSVAQTEFMLKAKGGASADEQKRFDQMRAEAARIKSLVPGKDNPPILLGLPAEYYLDLKSYDPPSEARRLGIPMLFLQGERDFQVTMEDFNLWKAGLSGAKNVRFQTYVTLNDLFIAGEGPPSPAEYRKPGNVAEAVVDDISSWIVAQKH
jgi:dienelactone hydrolase